MQDYSKLQSGENGKSKCSLFDRLKDAIDFRDIEAVKAILTSKDKYLQEVLGTSITENNTDGTADSFTFLTYAIEYNSINVAHTILDTTDKDDLKKLLSVESRIYYNNGTKKSYTALSLAEENGYTDLAEKIEGKMKELKIPILRKENKTDPAEELRRMQESLKKEHESARTFHRVDEGDLAKMQELGIPDKKETLKKGNKGLVPSDNRDENFTIRRASNNLFWAVLWRDGKAVKNTLKNSRNQGDTAQILKVGLIRLCIGNERAEALATKGNDKIIRDIKTGQALVINLIGLTMVFLATVIVLIALIPPELTAGSITGIVIAGFMIAVGGAGVGFAIFHDSYKIPDSKVEGVGTNKPPAQVQGPC